MPKDKVEAAIKRASGQDQQAFEVVLYEGYGPHGIAVVVETATDNVVRTVANVRMHFKDHGGNLGTTGSVAFQFQKMGVFRLAPEGIDQDALELDLIDHGLEELGESTGDWLWQRTHGIDDTPVEAGGGPAKSLSHEETFPRDINDDEALKTELLELVVRVAADLRGDGLRARTITVKLKDGDFTIRSASRTLDTPVQSDRPIFGIACQLLAKLRSRRRTGERLLGVALSHLTAAEGPAQLDLMQAPEASLETARDIALARAIDNARNRFGKGAILPGRIVKGPES